MVYFCLRKSISKNPFQNSPENCIISLDHLFPRFFRNCQMSIVRYQFWKVWKLIIITNFVSPCITGVKLHLRVCFLLYFCVFLFIFSFQFRLVNLQNIALSHVHMYMSMAKDKWVSIYLQLHFELNWIVLKHVMNAGT